MNSQWKKMDLSNVGDGAAAEQFEAALAEVVKDFASQSKEPKDKRTITLTIEMAMPGDGDVVTVAVSSQVKLAKRRPKKSTAIVQADGDVLQYTDVQEELPLLGGDVADFKEARKARGGE